MADSERKHCRHRGSIFYIRGAENRQYVHPMTAQGGIPAAFGENCHIAKKMNIWIGSEDG